MSGLVRDWGKYYTGNANTACQANETWRWGAENVHQTATGKVAIMSRFHPNSNSNREGTQMTKAGSALFRAFLLAGGIGVAALAHGAVLLDRLDNLTTSDPTYNRVTSGCGSLSGVGIAVFYKTYSITVAAGSPLFVSMSGFEGTVSFDTFVTVYTPSFNPAAALTNCVNADDDSGLYFDSHLTVAAPAAGIYTVVAASFANGATGDFRVCATQGTDELQVCLEPPRAIPTVSPWGLGGMIAVLGLIAGWALRRRSIR